MSSAANGELETFLLSEGDACDDVFDGGLLQSKLAQLCSAERTNRLTYSLENAGRKTLWSVLVKDPDEVGRSVEARLKEV